MSDDSTTKVNFKDIATAMSVQMLKSVYRKATTEYAKIIVDWAISKGANIDANEVKAAAEELADLLPEPAKWPQLEFNTTTGQAATNAKSLNPKKKKDEDDDSDKASGRLAKDYGALKVPEGVTIPCPVEIKSGARKNMKCGKECKRVLDAHDPSDPICAAFKCDHMYCGTHIVKVGKMDGTLALGRLEGVDKTGKVKPVVVDKGGKTTTLDTKLIGDLKADDTSEATGATIAKLFDRVNKQKLKE